MKTVGTGKEGWEWRGPDISEATTLWRAVLSHTGSTMEDTDDGYVVGGSPSPSSSPIGEAQKLDFSPDTTDDSVTIKIISAEYAPCEQQQAQLSVAPRVGPYQQHNVTIPHTRDVTPILRALLVAQKHHEQGTIVPYKSGVSLQSVYDNQRRTRVVLQQPDSKNYLFGDTLPGTSKRLYVRYIVEINHTQKTHHQAEVHTCSFAEHEPIVLKRNTHFVRDQTAVLQQAFSRNDTDTLKEGRKMGRSQTIAEFGDLGGCTGTTNATTSLVDAATTLLSDPPRSWRLRSEVSEMVLPLLMPFLSLSERMQCRLVCKIWKYITEQSGVTSCIDDNDPALQITIPVLRGLLQHSYSSLHSLFLSSTVQLQKTDLHPALPNLQKLKCLDISRCIHLDDSTLLLLAEHNCATLQVLYMKGLGNVTDRGIVAIARHCSNLQVLDISNIAITDYGASEMGQLSNLRALFLRDNYLLTNASLDVITEKCTSLEQLTLWGCTGLQHLSFDDTTSVFTSGNLILLNLWGCYNLGDDAALTLQGMNQLRSLVVSECHRLSDAFVTSMVQVVPQLEHLQLRYCKRLTDTSVTAITESMSSLFSLDLSFCTNVTIRSLFRLLDIRGETLVELRLQNCRLDLLSDRRNHRRRQGNRRSGQAGQQILDVIKSHGLSCSLSVLDVRQCGGRWPLSQNYPDDDAFVRGLTQLEFVQRFPGFFSRPARWNGNIERRLVQRLLGPKDVCS